MIDATLCGMSRVRISTTVESEQLEQCRSLLPVPDSELIDRALEALLHALEGEAERRALAEQPYEADPELSWEVPPPRGLAYEGQVPKDVLELAARRRRQRR